MSFGGLGNNIFNPALVGRVFLLISFPAQMTTWPVADILPMTYTDAQTGATTLSLIHYSKDFADAGMAAIGLTGGSLGEMSEIALLIGFAYMLFRKIITWHIPVTILVTVAVFTGILYIFNPTPVNNPLIHLTSGGLMLGSVFMATDYVTSPMAKKGTVVYGIGIGVLTVLIRVFGAYPEGMSFSILIMNGLTPLINTYFKPKHFGGK